MVDAITTSNQGFAATRRTFLGAVAAGAWAASAPAILRGADPTEKKLRVAVIGAGGRGGGDTAEVAAAGAEIVALCDVNERNLDAAGRRYPSAKKFVDFRKLYETPESFDAVIVATTEHTHAFATLPALQLGKHVYCEKPLTHNVWEARVIREAARQANVATQQGTQIHAGENYRRVVELIQTGAIGHVREAHVWTSRAWGWHPDEATARAAGDRWITLNSPEGSTPVPPYLDWDLWLGPAKTRPFHRDYFPGPKWYRWWDFGNGTMSDLGSHRNDLPFWALKLTYPETIEADGPPPHPEIAPASMKATYQFPQRGDMPRCTLTWYQGQMKPAIWEKGGVPKWGEGILFIGDDGMILADYGKHVLLPEDKYKDFTPPKPFIPRSPGHHAEWVQACKTGSPTTCHFEYAGLLTEMNHLGNVAYRVGKKLVWDPIHMKALGVPEADQYIRREYHNGWKLI